MNETLQVRLRRAAMAISLTPRELFAAFSDMREAADRIDALEQALKEAQDYAKQVRAGINAALAPSLKEEAGNDSKVSVLMSEALLSLNDDSEQLRVALHELDDAVCAMRAHLSPEALAMVPELTRAGLDLALVHGRRALKS